MKWGWLLLIVLGLLPGCVTPPPPVRSPELVIVGGRIWTGDSKMPWAEAMAFRDGRIVEIGGEGQVLAIAGRGAQVLRLEGQLVVPGFIDSHVHFLEGGAGLLASDFRSARSARELGERLGSVARERPEGEWISEGSFDPAAWTSSELPTRQDIDSFTPGHPVFLQRADGHMALANSRALALAGVNRATPDPTGGLIVRDSSGEPTGILKEAAMDLVSRLIPPPPAEVLFERARAALRHAASLGVTGVHDMASTRGALEVYRVLRDQGELTLRVTAYLPAFDQTPIEARNLRRSVSDHLWIRVAGIKAFADGSVGSSTAAFREPYTDAPASSGLMLSDLSPNGRLENQVVAFCNELFQPAIHAVGDRANSEVLDLLRRVDRQASHPFHPPFREFRIEHAQHLQPTDVARFNRYGVVASVQPAHLLDDGCYCERKIGAQRAQMSFPFRSLLDQGATLAFGTDWPVASLSPFQGLYGAVTRRTSDGRNPNGWIPEQKISLEEALTAYTTGSARAAMTPVEHGVGRLSKGNLADCVVLDEDLFSIDPEQWKTTTVAYTIVGGRVVYTRGR